MTIQSLLKEAKKLTPAQREKLAAGIMSTLKEEEAERPPSDEVTAELDRRWAEHIRNPDAGMTREQLRRKLAQSRKKRRA